jgi:hypothetical protein
MSKGTLFVAAVVLPLRQHYYFHEIEYYKQFVESGRKDDY